MTGVREYWNVLECNRGSTRFSLLDTWKESDLADRTAFGRNSRKGKLKGQILRPLRSVAGRIRSPFSFGPTPVPGSQAD